MSMCQDDVVVLALTKHGNDIDRREAAWMQVALLGICKSSAVTSSVQFEVYMSDIVRRRGSQAAFSLVTDCHCRFPCLMSAMFQLLRHILMQNSTGQPIDMTTNSTDQSMECSKMNRQAHALRLKEDPKPSQKPGLVSDSCNVILPRDDVPIMGPTGAIVLPRDDVLIMGPDGVLLPCGDALQILSLTDQPSEAVLPRDDLIRPTTAQAVLPNVAPTDETPRKPLPRPKRPAETDIAIPEPEITVKKLRRTVDSLSDSDMVELFGSPDSSDASDENQQK